MEVDEAGTVGTDDPRQLLTATTAASVKTVLVAKPVSLSSVTATVAVAVPMWGSSCRGR